MDDREVVAAIAAGDSAGIAVAYDRYAAALYGYCHWMLREPADAADAMGDTFVIAAATLGGLPEAPKLRPWLYAVARNECLRRSRTRSPVRDEVVDAAGQAANAADRSADVSRDRGSAELRTLILAILAELKPREREVIELSLRHDLYDADLAVALGVSWSRAHALASHALGHLDKALRALLVACDGREACPVLDTLLTGWDGRLTKQTRELVGGHIERCETCADSKWGTLRPAALTGLLPQAARPPELREKVLRQCSSTSPDTVAYPRRAARRTGSMWPPRFSQRMRLVKRGSARPAAAAMVLVVWLVALWVVSLTLLIFAGSHPSRALAPQSAVRTLTNSPAPAVTTAPTTPTSADVSPPSPSVSPSVYHMSPQVGPSASPTLRPEPSLSKSPSPKPSKSPSPSPSPSPSRKPSPSPSPSSSRSSSPPPA